MTKGHNFFGGLSAEHLKQFIERIERLEEEKKNISEDIKEVFAEAKGMGFDVATMKQIMKLRKKEPADLEEEEYLLDTYKRAMGMLPDLFDEDENPAIRDNNPFETDFHQLQNDAQYLFDRLESLLDEWQDTTKEQPTEEVCKEHLAKTSHIQ